MKTLRAKQTNQRPGLIGRRARVEMAGGTLLIEPEPGQGRTERAAITFRLRGAA